jgi:hypothetical protein
MDLSRQSTESQSDITSSMRREKLLSQGSYDSLEHSEVDESSMGLLRGQWSGTPKDRLTKWKIGFVCVSITTALAFMGAFLYLSMSVHSIEKAIHLQPTGAEIGDCGSSHTVEEARAMGCKFDPMSWLWVRPECYDQELIDDFMNRTEWSWHTDWKLTPETEVPLDIIFRGDHPQLFTAKKYHAIHCQYMVSVPRSFSSYCRLFHEERG